MSFINKLFGSILSAFNAFTGHYVLALLLFALLVKLILLPFGIKQQKNSIKQARFKPKEMAIRAKYKGRTDQPTMQKMQTEIQELYQKEGYNPLGGCLPLIIQMVIIWILYRIVYNPLQYISGYDVKTLGEAAKYVTETLGESLKCMKDGNFIGNDIYLIPHLTEATLPGINEALSLAGLGPISLASLPNFTFLGLNLADNPSWSSWLVLVPLLNCVFTFSSMMLNRKLTFQPMQEAQGQKSVMVMNIMMTALTTLIAFSFPAALGIYWIYNTVLGVLQQFILYKAMPLPKFTEEDYKQAEREYMGKCAKKEDVEKRKAALARPLDEDEYADLGEYHSVYDEKPEPEEPAPSGDSRIDKAPIKKKKK